MAFQELGYVHRDLSTGNFYLGADGKGKVSDLEYARKLTDPLGLGTDTLDSPLLMVRNNIDYRGTV